MPTKRPLTDAWQLTVKIFFVDSLFDILCVNVLPIFSQMRKKSYMTLIRIFINDSKQEKFSAYCETHQTKFDRTRI